MITNVGKARLVSGATILLLLSILIFIVYVSYDMYQRTTNIIEQAESLEIPLKQ